MIRTNEGLARATTSGPVQPSGLRVGMLADFGTAVAKSAAGAGHGAGRGRKGALSPATIAR